jgi:hypothetical protein
LTEEEHAAGKSEPAMTQEQFEKTYKFYYGHCEMCADRKPAVGGLLFTSVAGCVALVVFCILRMFANACKCNCGDKILAAMGTGVGALTTILLIAGFGASFACPNEWKDGVVGAYTKDEEGSRKKSDANADATGSVNPDSMIILLIFSWIFMLGASIAHAVVKGPKQEESS